MSKEKEINEEVKEIEEIEEVEANCECCEHDDCDCCDCEDSMDYPLDFAPVHKSLSFANIFSITSKVIACIYFIVGTIGYVTMFNYNINAINEYYAAYPEEIANQINLFLSDYVPTYFTTVLLITFAFVAIGEVINLLNRTKEALY